MGEYETFIRDTLIPAAHKVLADMYAKHSAGDDIGIEIKADQSPASLADRNAEEALRALIRATYPAHAVWGEEFGGTNIGADYTWVLDPLDGTREFLARRPNHFGTLIGLLHKGRPVCGVIGNPLDNQVWTGGPVTPTPKASISCTNPTGMFGDTVAAQLFNGLEVKTGLNCIGFAYVADGTMAAAIETKLSLHDIVALIPVLAASGATVLDLDGNDYTNHIFDLPADTTRKYGIVTGHNQTIVNDLLERYAACPKS